MSDNENPSPSVPASNESRGQYQRTEPVEVSYAEADRVLTVAPLDEEAALDMLYHVIRGYGPDDHEWVQHHLVALAERANTDRLLHFIIVSHELMLLWRGNKSLSFVQTYTAFATLLRRHPHLDAHIREQAEWIEWHLFHRDGDARATDRLLQALIGHGEREPHPWHGHRFRRQRPKIRPVRRRRGRR